ncbi:LysM peptidoglycan-binding domain-containing protein [Rubritalea tangerina]|uniref:LysM peptidoglycan-binding domain-containing protein n=2 Tax=Rubritalea tangerina TaxID=430798 RepID=A0ABW4ZCF7_9BACT
MPTSTPPNLSRLSLCAAGITTSLCLLLASCGHQAGGTIEVYETVGYQPNFGPFDSNGNYVDKWADNPPRRKYISRDKKKSTSTPLAPAPAPEYAAAPPKKYTPPPPVKASNSTSRKKQSVAVKPKSKPPITHTVRKGDTLYGLSRKYGTSVSAIQRANRIKGTTIGIGQRLIIPR